MRQFTPDEFAMTEDSNGKMGSGAVLEVTEFLRQVQPHADFQAVLQEIDEAIYGDNIFQKSNASDMELSLNQDGKMVCIMGLDVLAEYSGSQNLSREEDSFSQQIAVHVGSDNLFNPAWINKPTSKKSRKGGASGSKAKAQQISRSPTHESEIIGTQKKGTWVQVSRPHTMFIEEDLTKKEGPKKHISKARVVEESKENERRIKVNDEAKHLSLLLA